MELKCTPEFVQEVQNGITQARQQYGPGSDQHAEAVAWAEAQGPALVADYLTLHAELTQMRGLVDRTARAVLDRQSFLRVPRFTDAHPGGMDAAEAVGQGFDDLHAELNQAREREAELRGALEWYGDPRNWEQGLGRDLSAQDSAAQMEEGQRARAALADARGRGGGGEP